MDSPEPTHFSSPQLLDPHCDISGFDCGKPALNEWLRKYALSNQRNGFTRVVVVLCQDIVVGFYGLAPSEVPPASLPRSIRTGQHPTHIPAILIGQLAVDKAYTGVGLGSALLRHALERAVEAAKIIGGRVIVVRAIDHEAEGYWQSNGFLSTSDNPSILFRSIQNVAAWLDTPVKSS